MIIQWLNLAGLKIANSQIHQEIGKEFLENMYKSRKLNIITQTIKIWEKRSIIDCKRSIKRDMD